MSSLFTTKITGAKLRNGPRTDSWYTFNGPHTFDEVSFFSQIIPENIKCKFMFWGDAVNLEVITEEKKNPAKELTRRIEKLYERIQTRQWTEKELSIYKKLKYHEAILESENRHYEINTSHFKSPRDTSIETCDYIIFYHSFETLDIETIVTLYKIVDDMKLQPEKVILLFSDETAEKTHDEFCVRNDIVNRINVIGASMFNIQCRYEFTMDYFNKYYPIMRDNILNKKSRKNRFFSLTSRMKLSRQRLIDMFDKVDNFDISDLSKGKVLDPWNFKSLTTPEGITKTIDELYDQDFKFDAEIDEDMNKYIYFADNSMWRPEQERLYKLYLDYYIEIVCESNTELDQYTFLSEKIYKPLYYGQPFGLIGNRGTLEHLRKMGFETYPEIFDESYDTHPRWQDRFDSLTSDIKTLLTLSDKDFENIIYSVGDKSIHNIHNYFEGETQMEYLRNKFYNIMKSVWEKPEEEFIPPKFIKNLQ